MMHLLEVMKINQKPKSLIFLWIGLALFSFYTLHSIFELIVGSSTIDPLITSYLQKTLPRFVDTPFSIFSLIGTFEITSLVVLFMTYFIWHKEKRFFWAFGFFAFILIFELIGKFFLYHPGPPKIFFRYSLPFNLSTVHVATSYAFPSGHMSRTIFIALIISQMIKRHINKRSLKIISLLFLAAFTLLMAISRIYLGEHWASDVLGGLFLGSSMAMFALLYY